MFNSSRTAITWSSFGPTVQHQFLGGLGGSSTTDARLKHLAGDLFCGSQWARLPLDQGTALVESGQLSGWLVLAVSHS